MKTKLFLTIISILIIVNAKAQTWFPIGIGANNVITAFFTDTVTNTLYVGGAFTQLNGVSANKIIKYDGYNWTPMGSGMSSTVNAIIKYNGEIYAGGDFQYADGNTVNAIAKWNGTSWVSVGQGICTYGVRAMEIYNGELYAAGAFSPANGSSYNIIAKWNGTTWTNIGSTLTGPNLFIYALKTFNGELYAGGWNFYGSGVSAMTIAKWNGTNWSDLYPGTNGSISTLEIYNNKLFVGGAFDNSCGWPTSSSHVAIWTGSEWQPAGIGMDNVVQDFAVYDGELYAGGNFLTADGDTVNHIAKWNGTNWSAMPSTGLNDWVYELGVYNSDLYAGGNFTTAGGTSAQYIARWSTSNNIFDIYRNNDIKVYPLPFNNNATIEFENHNEIFSLTIFDSKGQSVQQINNIASGQVTIERKNMVRGLYFFTLRKDKSIIYSGKIIVE